MDVCPNACIIPKFLCSYGLPVYYSDILFVNNLYHAILIMKSIVTGAVSLGGIRSFNEQCFMA